MKHRNEKGFSLIEVLIVVVIIGIIAVIAVPSLIRARIVSENRAAVATLTTIRSAQATYYASNKRFARMDELVQDQNRGLGANATATQFQRGSFVYELTSPSTDNDLRVGYQVTATRINDTPFSFVYTLNQTGVINGIEGL